MRMRDLDVGDWFVLEACEKQTLLQKTNMFGEFVGFMNCVDSTGNQFHVYPGYKVIKLEGVDNGEKEGDC